MRSLVAKCLALLTGVAILVLALLFGFLQNRPTEPAPITPRETAGGSGSNVAIEAPERSVPTEPNREAELARGRAIYDRERCAACHSVRGEGNRRNPLDGVGARLDRDSLRRWIVEPEAMDPPVRKPDYDGISEIDLAALVAWLESLRD